MAKSPIFERVSLIGLGLIGSSLARVMRRDGLARHIAGCAKSEATRAKALELDLVDSVTADPAEAARGADLVVICTPLGTYAEIGAAIAPKLAPGVIVSDVGSVKGAAIRLLAPLMPEGVHLVPAHPVAGTEFSGPEAGFAELFAGRWCIITPPGGAAAARGPDPGAATAAPTPDNVAIERVAALWRNAGMQVEIMDAEHHDVVMAITSHVPHLIAYTIVGTATDLEAHLKSEVIKFSAAGFRDFTRIAASDPVMWRDIFLNNREAVLEALGRLTEDLTALQRAIRRGEGEILETLFTRTRAIRRSIIEAKQV